MFRITKKIAFTDDEKPINESKLNFKNYFVYVLPNGMGKNRTELFRNAVVKNSGCLIDENKPIEIDPNFKYLILFDENTIKTWDSLEKSLGKKSFFLSIKSEFGKNFIFLKSSWLSECLRIKKIVEIKNYELKLELEREIENKNEQINSSQLKRSILIENDTQNKKKIRLNKIETDSSDEENQETKLTKNFLDYDNESSYSEDEPLSIQSNQEFVNLELNRTKCLLDNKTWTCAHSSKEQMENLNKHITDKLEQMSSIYENTKEKYKALGYQKAILILKRHPLVIQSREEALALPGIGKSIAEKIAEIIQFGDIRKLNEMNSREDLNSLKMFTEIHGVGPTTAKLFVSQGFRTLEDLRTKANLTKQQKIGLKFYDDFKQRIPREEVEKIEATVKEAALSLNNGLIVQTCGSYRRGKATCGDVDILITHPDKKSHKNIFTRLIHLLHEKSIFVFNFLFL
ncbi:unnamed protein product [Brachionus calyciflorus]|uniref:DNA polymerase n=1 Tax=Brachionus calyciflorus TaxID=104777 RepID=A0A813MBZ5_9BILA|nr:unnamed protein product [Brachionus calyciflorus]